MSDVNVTEKVREALRQNLRDTTGDCVCDPAYTERELIDPHCGWHEAEGTTDDDSVARVLAALSDPEVLAKALREAAEGLRAGVRGSKCNPGCHEADQITLRLRADRIEKEDA